MDLMRMIFGLKNDPVSRAIDEAIELFEEKDFDGGMAVLRDKALTRAPGHTRALLHLGVGHMLKGELDKAEEILRPLAGQKPMNSESAAASIALEKIAAGRRSAK